MKCLFLFLAFQTQGRAEPTVNVMAHVGTSFMVDTVAYKINSTCMSKPKAETLSALETLLLGLAYKGSEGYPANTRNSMLENSLGIGLSIGVRYEF